MTYWQFLLYSKYLLLIMTDKVYWRVFFDHTFDLLNQFLLSYIRFSNSLIIPYLSFFLPIRYHQKAIQLSIRSQRQERCTIRKTLIYQRLADYLIGIVCFFSLLTILSVLFYEKFSGRCKKTRKAVSHWPIFLVFLTCQRK